ncbi:hypothetical protein PMAC_001087 [Pneumocystis sp. 'macacae']|nr:hypothetical protein PMAC_001087 [Pneumocystis sp. 'macacae']
MLKPVSVILKSDDNIQDSSKFKEKDLSFFFLLKTRNVDTTTLTNSTFPNNGNPSFGVNISHFNVSDTITNSTISFEGDGGSGSSGNDDSGSSGNDDSGSSGNGGLGSTKHSGLDLNNSTINGKSNSTASNKENITNVSENGENISHPEGPNEILLPLNGTKPNSSSDATSLETIIIKTLTDTVTNTVTAFPTVIETLSQDSTQITLSSSTETSYENTIATSYETVSKGTTVSHSISQVSTFTSSSESYTTFPNDQSDSSSHKFDIFRTRTLLMIIAPVLLFIIMFIIILWYWRRKSNRVSKAPPRKQVEDYNIMPIITGETGGIQRTNYLERNQPYGSGIDDSNRWGYRGWGPTNFSPNNKPLLTRNNSIASTNASVYQKQDCLSKINEDKDMSQTGMSGRKSSNRLSGMANSVARDDFQNTKPFKSKNLATHISGPVSGSFHDALPYPSNTHNLAITSKNGLRQDYGFSSTQENSVDKPYSYSDIPRSLSSSQRKTLEDRRDGSQRHSIMSQKYPERPQLYNFSKT